MTRHQPADVCNESLQHATAELVRRLQAGEPCRAESLFAAYPDLSAHEEAALELIYSEFVTRRQLGEKPTPDEWYGRFPHWRERLERLFLLHEILDPDSDLAESTVSAELEPLGPEPSPSPKKKQRSFERYERREKIGRGAMGVVYKAVQSGLGRVVAIKVLLGGAYAEPEERQRFHHEARTVARLRHANIVQIYDFGDQEDEPFLVMEFVEGGNLAEKIAGKPQPPGWAAEMVETLARAMHYAHQQGIIHRDLKPANILLQSEGTAENHETHETHQTHEKARGGKPSGSLPLRPSASSAAKNCTPKITDFGLAKWLEEGFSQTISGELVGTPGYMAPEQARGKSKEVGVWTDVYALGAILYELLTGRPPFVGETRTAVLQQVQIEEPVSPRRLLPAVPHELETICLKCLEKEPGRRYGSAEALAEDLRRYRQQEPIRARPVGPGKRAAKWARHRPKTAIVLGASGLIIVALLLGLLLFSDLLNQQKELVSSKRHSDYVLAIREAQRAYENGFIERAPEILARQQPSLGQMDLRDFTWYFLWRLRPREPQCFAGHRGWVNDVAFSPDGQLMATGGEDASVKVWSLATCQFRDFIGHNSTFADLTEHKASSQLTSAA